jgi:hypothetical protein
MTPVNEVKAGRLTEAQLALLQYLDGTGKQEACERVCHPNTAAALERRGLLTIEDGDGSFRPWFDCRITPAGRAALQQSAGFQVSQSQPLGVLPSEDTGPGAPLSDGEG